MFDFLNEPKFFNLIREIIAGKQENTKEFVKSNIKKYESKSVIDICCGTGDFASCADGVNYVGLDYLDDYIEFAKQKYRQDRNKKFMTFDILKRRLALNKYDCALLISTLHHFSDQELDIIFKDLKASVRGILIIADLDASPPGLLRKILVKLDRGRFVRPNSQKLILLKKYFKVLKTQTIFSRLAVQYGVICKV